MAEPADTREMVQRALTYPYAIPAASYVHLDGRASALPPEGVDLSGRRPLLAYGSNAAPAALSRKLATLPRVRMPVLRAELGDFDAVYSAHVSPYGSVPATLRPSPGTTLTAFVAFPTDAQLELLTATEPNYELVRLENLSCRLDGAEAPAEVDAFLSRHGFLSIGGAEIALAAMAARGRRFGEMSEPRVLELVRSRLFPELGLERFVLDCIGSGGLAPLPDLSPA